MDKFSLIRTFVEVASRGSFSASAEYLGMSPQLVSKYVGELERRLTTRLLNRTTRRLHLTEAGERYLIRAQHLLSELEDMDNEVTSLQGHAQGKLRISAPLSFGIKHLPSLLRRFQTQYSNVDIDLQLNDRRVDIIEEGFDIVLRIGELQDSTFIAKRLAPIRLVLCASPDYLDKHGRPQTLEELSDLHYLRYSLLNSEPEILSPFYKNTAQRNQRHFECNNGDVIMEMALQGAGVCLQPSFICGEHLANNNLEVVLPNESHPIVSLWAVYAHRQLLASKVRAFIETADGFYGESPYWDNW